MKFYTSPTLKVVFLLLVDVITCSADGKVPDPYLSNNLTSI